MAAQLLHAAGESFNNTPRNRGSPIYAVALAAENEAALLQLEERLQMAGVAHVAIREPDSPYNGALMAIGFQPAERKQLQKYVRNFSLIGEKS